jgi:hypothetical protein
MWEFLETIENSGFATWVRETPTVLGYSTVLALHTFGMAFLVGLSGVIALRVLGIFPELPLKPLERFFPLILAGFWLNAATGVVLTMLAVRSLALNPDFYVKLAAIVCAIIGLRRLKGYAFDHPAAYGEPPAAAKRWAAAMIFFWGIAVVAGRLTAYTNFVRIRTVAAVVVTVAILAAVRFVFLRSTAALRVLTRPLAPAPPAPVQTSIHP